MTDVKALYKLENINISVAILFFFTKERPGREPTGYLLKVEMARGIAGWR